MILTCAFPTDPKVFLQGTTSGYELLLLLLLLLNFILLGCFPQTYGLLTGAPRKVMHERMMSGNLHKYEQWKAALVFVVNLYR